MNEQERRIYQAASIEVRADDDGPRHIEGYAAVFNARSHNLGGFVEQIAPGAFARTLAGDPDVRATIDHKGGLHTIGRTRNGSLRLWEDETGLRFRVVPPDTQAGRDALTLVQRRDIDQMSFAFRVADDGDDWTKTDDGTPLRTLRDVELDDGDVALVTYPAYPQTSAEARDMASNLAEDNDHANSTGDEPEGGQATDGEDVGSGAQARLELLRMRLELAQEQ